MKSYELPILIKKIIPFIEPATIVAIIFGSIYYLGWTCMDYYFKALGIHHDSLDLSIYFYIREVIIYFIFILFISFWSLKYVKNAPINGKQALRANFLISFISLFVLYIGIRYLPRVTAYLFIAIGCFGLIYYIFLSLKKISIPNHYWFTTPKYRLHLLITLLAIFWLVSAYSGMLQAINTIEGTSDHILINFSWKDNTPIELEGKELILITHHDGKYYVVIRQTPAPAICEAYVIQDDQIKYAVTKKIDPQRDLLNNLLKRIHDLILCT